MVHTYIRAENLHIKLPVMEDDSLLRGSKSTVKSAGEWVVEPWLMKANGVVVVGLIVALVIVAANSAHSPTPPVSDQQLASPAHSAWGEVLDLNVSNTDHQTYSYKVLTKEECTACGEGCKTSTGQEYWCNYPGVESSTSTPYGGTCRACPNQKKQCYSPGPPGLIAPSCCQSRNTVIPAANISCWGPTGNLWCNINYEPESSTNPLGNAWLGAGTVIRCEYCPESGGSAGDGIFGVGEDLYGAAGCTYKTSGTFFNNAGGGGTQHDNVTASTLYTNEFTGSLYCLYGHCTSDAHPGGIDCSSYQ